MIKIAPSILSADFTRLKEDIQAVEAAGADWIHIDVMDGHFVPNITMGPLIVAAVKQVTRLPLDVHLMITQPERYIGDFVSAGADYLTVSVEACVHLQRTLAMIREADPEKRVKAGAALNPATPLSAIEWVLDDLDLILLMTVNPGFGGQKFIPESLPKIRKLRQILQAADKDIPIQVDGGINADSMAAVAAAGATVMVAGSAIFGQHDYARQIATLRRLACPQAIC